MPYGFYFDPTYILVIIGSVFVLAASAYMRSTYSKYSKVFSQRGITGANAAQTILRSEGIHDVQLLSVHGELTDHYDPRNKSLNLSDGSRTGTSIADLGVAAHEVGHAIQHHEQYFPLHIRNLLVPITNIGATLSWPIIIVGMMMGMNRTLIMIGVILFLTVLVFQIVTLPVEFNASRRAIRALEVNHILSDEELRATKKVLTAAALTYVAAAASTLLQVLRLLLLTRGRSSRRD